MEHRSSETEGVAAGAESSQAVSSRFMGIAIELDGSTGVFCIMAVVKVGIRAT